MKSTSIIFHDELSPIWPKPGLDGFAKTETLAMWLFVYTGWQARGGDLLICVEEEEWPESELYFPSNPVELWVLGNCLQMN